MKKKVDNTDNAVLLQVISEQQKTIEKLHEQLEQLQHRLDKMLHLLYGTKSEKKPKSNAISVSDRPSSTALDKKPSKSSPAHANGRRPLPIELP